MINLVRSCIAQAYLQHLVALHPPLAAGFSRILSAGIAASKPGVQASPGVEFMLRDYNINSKFSHTSRRLERRDVEKFEYILTMNGSQRDSILSRWPLRLDKDVSRSSDAGDVFREDIQHKVVILGSFGDKGEREVAVAESINGEYWFHAGTQRIYPGYDKCFNQNKNYIADFVLDLTGYDVNQHPLNATQGFDSRDVSHEVSEDEAWAESFPDPNWGFDQDRSGIEALRREISRCESAKGRFQLMAIPASHARIISPDVSSRHVVRAHGRFDLEQRPETNPLHLSDMLMSMTKFCGIVTACLPQRIADFV